MVGTTQVAPGKYSFVSTGVFKQNTTQNAERVYQDGTEVTKNQYGISFSASRSSSVYQDNAHVRPISRGTCFYIKY